ncbi:hypothetical protein [Natronincola ferrireducens]|uniref:Copper amine oxidase N-terminal domain-containing protein n=1 Tax=Natronincola ferrireducens TaxID=393762 RepID=A0A1G8X0E3_9FIRM|nr:hypothetical protein [Natronincola ferrireducens]SDJ84109.1 hypothetical protein SAMN05660472_00084 [Natronincola ferrireducens]
MRRKSWLILGILLCLLSLSSVAFGQGYSRNITAEFNDIKIVINNLSLPLRQDIFIHGDEVYVPLRDLAKWLYFSVEYDEANHRIGIDTGSMLKDPAAEFFAGMLLQRDYEIAVLSRALKNRNDSLYKTRRTYASSRDRIYINEGRLERHLDRYLPSYYGIDFHYEVTGHPYDIDLVVYFTNKDFYNWSTARQNNFLNRLKREIEDYDDHLDVYGVIHDDYKDKDVLFFSFENGRVYSQEDAYTKPNRTITSPKPTTLQRNMMAWFHPVTMEIDGNPFNILKEPFFIGEEIYMPLTELADALYWMAEYLPEEGEVRIRDNNFYSREYVAFGNQLLRQRDLEIDRLVADLERTRRLPTPYRSINSTSRMQTYLRDYFDMLEDIEMRISFSHRDGDDYRLTITYPRSSFSDFDGIRKSIIEYWVENMVDAIRELYDPHAEITGSIQSTPSSTNNFTDITFNTNRDRIYFNFRQHGK